MEIIIVSPIADLLLTAALKEQLQAAGNVTIITDIKPLTELSELQTDAPKIVAIDPDFCDWNITAADIDSMKNVAAFCLPTTSFSWIDIKRATELKIPVTNCRGFSTLAVAEWAIMMSLNVARKIPILIKDEWKHDFAKHEGIELIGKKAGIIGLGAIGTRIAEICTGLGMEVSYWSKSSKDDRFNSTSLNTLMSESDFVFPTLALNENTKSLITDDLLKSMKETAIFTSIVHDLYNHKLLLELAASNKIYGYAYESSEETMTSVKGNVWVAPALAWCTKGAMLRNGVQLVDAVVKASKNNFETRVE